MQFRIGELEFKGLECGPFCDMGTSAHVNAMPWEGTLLILDEPSTKPPNGAEGHLIFVPKKVAKQKLKTLIGMGINYATDLSGHQPRRKVGVITHAWIDGGKVKVRGQIWKKDFPEASQDLKQKALGMSMELADVLVEDKDSRVWKLIDFTFTGATILRKSAAAYFKTALAAAEALALQLDISDFGGKAMPDKDKNKAGSESQAAKLVNAIAASVGPAVAEAMKGTSDTIKTGLEAIGEQIKEGFDSMQTSLNEQKELLAAGVTAKGSDSSMSAAVDSSVSAAASSSMSADADVAAGKKGEDDSSDDDDSSADDELAAELEHLAKNQSNSLANGNQNPEPGKLNKNAKNKGHKTSVSAAAATSPRFVAAISAASQRIATLQSSVKKVKKALRASKARERETQETIESMEAQINEFTERQNRRTISPDLTMLLTKAGHDVNEIMASGKKLTVAEVDAAFQESGLQLSPADRITFKTVLVDKGLMEQGEVKRF
jgi:hypothetical protein